MATVRTDNVQITLEIDGSQSKTELDNLTRKAQVLKDDLKGLKKGTEEYVAANEELKQVNTRIGELREELGLSALSYNQLSTMSRQLNRELRDLTPGTEAFLQKSQQLQEVDAQLLKVRNDIKGIGQELGVGTEQFTDFVQLRDEVGLVGLSLTQLKGLAGQLSDELDELTPGTDAFVQKTKELQQVNGRLAEVRKEVKGVTDEVEDFTKTRDQVGMMGLTMTQLKGLVSQLEKELAALTPGTEAFITKSKELGQAERRLEDVKEEAEKIGGALDESGNGFLGFVKKSAAFAGIQIGIESAVDSLRELGRESIQAAKEGSDSISDMEKSLNVTTAEAQALRGQLEGIDTRTSQQNLEGIAVAAGQLGIAKEQAVAFTQSVDQAVVALGDEFTGGVEDVTKSLGGLQKLFKQTADLSPADAILKIGSAVNALGADGTASGPVVAEFTARLGQLGDLSPQITQTLGLGAAFQELGLSAEISAGGLSNILLQASKDTAKFAQQIGLTNEQFQQLLNSDPNDVILRLAESLRGASNTEVVSTLDRLGIKSQEAVKVMSLLANQTDLVRQKQALAATEFEKGSSLTDEFAKKNNNAAGELEKAEKKLTQYRRELGEQLLPVYIRGTQLLGLFLEALKALPEFIEENRGLLAGLAVALLTLNAANIRAAASAVAQVAVEKGRAVATRASAAAQWLLNAAMTANPIGVVIAAVALLVGAYVTLYERSETVRKVLAGLGAAAKAVFANIKDYAVRDLSGVADLLVGIFTFDKAKIASGLKQLQSIGTDLAAAYHKGYQEQEAVERAKEAKQEQAHQQAKQQQQAKRQQEVLQQEQQSYIERLKLRQAELERQLALVEEGSRRELELKKQLVLVGRDLELANEKKSAADKAIIQSKALVEISKLNRDFERKQAKERLDAEEKLAQQRAALLQDETQRRIQQLTAAAEKEKAAVKGSAEQQAEQRRLIEQKLQQDVAEVRRAAAQKQLEEDLALEQQRNGLIVDAWQRREAQLRTAARQEEAKILDTDRQAAEKRRLIAEKLAQDLAALARERARVEEEVARRIEASDADLALRKATRARTLADQRDFLSQEAVAAAEAEKAARLAVLQGELREQLSNEQLSANERLALWRKYHQDRQELDEEYAQQEQDRRVGSAAFMLQATSAVLGAFADFSKIASDKELARLEKEKQARLKKLDEEYKLGKVSKENYEKQKSGIESTYSEKARVEKRRAAQEEKKWNVAQSVMLGILSVLQAVGLPAKILAGIAAAVATAKIIATPVPEFGLGGVWGGVKRGAASLWSGTAQRAGEAWRSARRYASGGRINPVAGVADVGQLHSNRGIQMVDGATGEHLGEWERGEPYMILSRATYQNNRQVIDELINTSLYHGGAPIRRGPGYYQDGGVRGELPEAAGRPGGGESYGPQLVAAINRTTAAVEALPSRQYAVVGEDQIPVIEEMLQERADIRTESAVR